MLELSKLYPMVQDKITSNSHTHSPTKTVGRGENNTKQDICDRVQTVHTVQNVSLTTVQKGGGQLSSAKLRKILRLRLICAVKSSLENRHIKRYVVWET